MTPIHNGRHTARLDGDFVVFLIGMRINRLLALRRWVPVARAMGPMVEHLMQHRELGLLHAETFVQWRGVGLVQYWRSFEQLERFARDPALLHVPAWRAFNQAVGGDGSVGIWHETYRVRAGEYECIYGNMPRRGLALAGEHLPVAGARETARGRLGLRDGASQPGPRAGGR